MLNEREYSDGWRRYLERKLNGTGINISDLQKPEIGIGLSNCIRGSSEERDLVN